MPTTAFDLSRSSRCWELNSLHALFEITAQHVLQIAAVRTNDLREEVTAHHRIGAVFLLGDHLQEDAASDVVPAISCR
jgi:hypothetical protein